ncbi:extracellular solute-binding protein [Nocardioides sp. 31GB23]|uniref:ABC transporter substrate-binding protein n=1 Tax=Nocardioides sp. 31GB23 TaxID=3156065 RepID=UPI0032AFB231
MNSRTLRTQGITLVAMTLALAGCGGDSGDADASSDRPSAECSTDWDATVAAAQDEGSLTWYTAVPSEVSEAVAAAFEEEYGIVVGFLKLPSTNLLQRYSAEGAAGNIGGDVLTLSGAELFAQTEGADEGWVEPIADLELPAIAEETPEQFVQEYAATVQTQPWIYSYNTDLVDAAPTSWEDLNGPEFADATFLLPDPASSAAYVEFWDYIEAEYGADFIQEFAETHEIRVYGSGGATMEALAAGEGAVRVPSTASSAAGVIAAGAPVDNAAPAATTGVEIQAFATACGASPNSNAARVFMNYLLTEDGNTLMSEFADDVSIYDDANLPAEYQEPNLGAGDRADEILELLNIGG